MRVPDLGGLSADDLLILDRLAERGISEKSPAAAGAFRRAIRLDQTSRTAAPASGPREAITFAFQGHDTPAGAGRERAAVHSWFAAAWRSTYRERPALAAVFRAMSLDIDDERRRIDRAPLAFDQMIDGVSGARIG